MSSPFLPEQLLPVLQQLPAAQRYWLAYSGGMDSSVLLHALVQLGERLPAPLSVVHVDHRLSADSGSWSAFTRGQCEALGVPFQELSVEVERDGKGLEAAAREARYAAFASVVGEGEMLLTAHHQDDQAETLLLQLLRGGGVRGLAAMPAYRPFATGWLGRPLLNCSRQQLQAYAESLRLQWIDDPSNFDTSLQRNYLRHDLLPLLEERQQGIRAILARSAGHFAESALLLDELAQADLDASAREEGRHLSIAALCSLSKARQRNLLRYWLRYRGLSIPDSRNLQRVLDELLPAAVDAEPLVRWPGSELRRYRNRLYAMRPLPPLPEKALSIPWQGEELITLPAGLGQLRARRVRGEGLSESLLNDGVTITWRRGGEKLVLSGRAGHHSLKKLYQEAGVPPWERQRRPLIRVRNELAQVAGLWSDQRFACAQGEQGILFEWSYAIEMPSENDDN